MKYANAKSFLHGFILAISPVNLFSFSLIYKRNEEIQNLIVDTPGGMREMVVTEKSSLSPIIS